MFGARGIRFYFNQIKQQLQISIFKATPAVRVKKQWLTLPYYK